MKSAMILCVVAFFVMSTSANSIATRLIDVAGARGREYVQISPVREPTIHGRIVDSETGVPIKNAVVSLLLRGSERATTTSSDHEGKFEFNNTSVGVYSIRASAPGYVSRWHGQEGISDPPRLIRVERTQTSVTADVKLLLGGVIAGQIVDQFGEPIAEVQVIAMQYQREVDGYRRLMTRAITASNDIGEFRLFGLTPGSYLLAANATRTARSGDIDVRRTGWGQTFYPGVVYIDQALAVSVRPRMTVNGITIPLQTVPLATITGAALDNQGRPLQGMVSAIPDVTVAGVGRMSSPIQSDGAFSLSAVPPGTYLLRTIGHNGPGREEAVTSVRVEGNDLRGVQLSARAPRGVSGRITFAEPVPNVSSSGMHLRLIQRDDMGVDAVDETTITRNWRFSTLCHPGSVRVEVKGLPTGVVVKSVRSGVEDLTDGFACGEYDRQDVEVELTSRITSLSGEVVDHSGAPLSSYVAIAFPQDESKWALIGLGLGGRARSEEYGRFSIQGLRPGRYYVTAVNQIDASDWTAPEYLTSLTKTAKLVILGEGNDVAVKLELSVGPK